MSLRVGRKELLTLKEAAERFGVSRPTLWRAVCRGTLKTVKVAGRHFVTTGEMKRYLKEDYHAEMAERVRVRWRKRKKRRGS